MTNEPPGDPDEAELIRRAMSAIGKRKSEKKAAANRIKGFQPGRIESAETREKKRLAQQKRRERERAEKAGKPNGGGEA